MSPLLAHDVVTHGAQPSRTVVFLHGILGSRNNWKSFAKRVVDAVPGWRAVVVDLRNHGDSHGFPGPHTVQACAADVGALLSAPGSAAAAAAAGDVVIVGHSYGGKVALALAQQAPQRARAIWSLDCPPGPRAFDGSEIGRVLDAIRAQPLPIPSRNALVSSLKERGLSDAIAQWMTTNLRALEGGAGFTWKLDLAAIDEMLASFGALDLWSVIEGERRGADDVVIVRAARSDRFTRDDIARLQRAVARGTAVEHVVDAGHWLHTENPGALLDVLLPALRAIEGRA